MMMETRRLRGHGSARDGLFLHEASYSFFLLNYHVVRCQSSVRQRNGLLGLYYPHFDTQYSFKLQQYVYLGFNRLQTLIIYCSVLLCSNDSRPSIRTWVTIQNRWMLGGSVSLLYEGELITGQSGGITQAHSPQQWVNAI